MKITLEQIDLIRKRTNVGYMQAKQALEMSNGDIVEALAYIEQTGGTTRKLSSPEGFIDKIKQLIHKGNITKLVISKDAKTIINIPVNLVIVAAIVAIHFVIISMLAALIFGCKFTIDSSAVKKSPNADIVPVNKTYETNDMNPTMNNNDDNIKF